MVAALFFTSSGFAQDITNNIRKITVEEAVQLAKENSSSLKQAKLDLDLAKKKKDYAWNSASPSLTVAASFGGGATGSYDAWSNGNQLEKDPKFDASATLNINLTSNLYTSIQAQNIEYEKAMIDYANKVRLLEFDIITKFYSCVSKKESFIIQQNGLKQKKQIYEANKVKYNLGQKSELDLLQSQYDYENTILNVDDAKRNLETDFETFKETLGLNISENIELDYNLDEVENSVITEKDITINIDEIPEIKRMELDISVQKNNLLDDRFSYFGPSITASTKATLDDLSFNYSLGVSIPLDGFLPWSAKALKIANTKRSLEKQEVSLEERKKQLSKEIVQSYKDIQVSKTKLEMLDKNILLAQKKYDMTLDAYNHGSRDLQTLQTASDSLMEAKNKRQSQIFNIINLILKLEDTLGLPYGTLGK